MDYTKFKRLFFKETKCEEVPSIEEIGEEDDLDFEEEHPKTTKVFIPSYRMLFHGLKSLTMSIPGMQEIEGFKLGVGIPLSNNFIISHTISMHPKEVAKPQF